MYNRRTIYLGLFDDEAEAAKARDRKAYELAGEFAYLNFPDEIARTLAPRLSRAVSPKPRDFSRGGPANLVQSCLCRDRSG